MDHYIEVRLLPDPEFPATLLMNRMFSALHGVLAKISNGEIGVSFPEAQHTPGSVLRLHSHQHALDRLMATQWLKGFTDYTQVSAVTPVPGRCQYCRVSRVQKKSNPERLYRRSVNKGWITQQEADEKLVQATGQRNNKPYLQLKSQSTDQRFRLYFDQTKPQETSAQGEFSSYGMSSVATVPWF